MTTKTKVSKKLPVATIAKLTLDAIKARKWNSKKIETLTALAIAKEASLVGEGKHNLRAHVALFMFDGGLLNQSSNQKSLYDSAVKVDGGTGGQAYKVMTATCSQVYKILDWQSVGKDRGSKTKPVTVNREKILQAFEVIHIASDTAKLTKTAMKYMTDSFNKILQAFPLTEKATTGEITRELNEKGQNILTHKMKH